MSPGHQLWIARGHFCLRNERPVKKRCTGTAMGAEGNFAAEAATIGGEPRRRPSSLRSLLEELVCFGGEALSKYGEEIHSGHFRSGTYRPHKSACENCMACANKRNKMKK